MRHRVLIALAVTAGTLLLTPLMTKTISSTSGSLSFLPGPSMGEEPMLGYGLLIYVLAVPIIFSSGVWREMPDEE
jgi:hypothetical protein